MFLHKKNINKKIQNLLKDITLKNIVDKKNLDDWDNTYKEIIDNIKSDIYKILLEHLIKTEDDIIKIIQNM